MERNTFSSIADMADNIKTYVEAKIDYERLSLLEKTVSILSVALSIIIVSLVGLVFVFFASLALGFWLGSLTDSNALGFLCVAGIYLVAGLGLWFGRETLFVTPFIGVFIRMLFSDKEAEQMGASETPESITDIEVKQTAAANIKTPEYEDVPLA
ncbi:MAG: hypothetical protein V4543_10095 [Bacteroidota bacterium]